ncbi:hypothetical protein [Limnoglobus roseus]|uniref:DUF3108 domain-containing protein n=1 Tax=Limnoglobus roseus TaxID=2598579 RepID=A0A5C1A749_9BACT|nr:hypothetical protein [Limnoglobus roseus]QEL13662.1 hypothetical protein PX52LOC_00520 [Limnoglobus roseus]
MPTRRGVVLILIFWLCTVGYVGYRDVWPHLFADTAPTAWIDLSDEATQALPVRWELYRGDTRVGKVSTQMSYDASTDGFRFVTKYRGDLAVDLLGVAFNIPTYDMSTTLDRVGRLRAQTMSATFAVKTVLFSNGGTATTEGVVKDGTLTGSYKLVAEGFDSVEGPLKPTPVPDGQALNPLQPVNRLRGVRPGMRWLIYEVNPMGEAIAGLKDTILKKMGTSLLTGSEPAERPAMIATVGDRPEVLKLKRSEYDCWVIEVRGEHGTTTVWVRVSDGSVMQQVAKLEGETMRLEREE